MAAYASACSTSRCSYTLTYRFLVTDHMGCSHRHFRLSELKHIARQVSRTYILMKEPAVVVEEVTALAETL